MKIISTGDWHLRDTKPRCVVSDNWFDVQLEQVEFILKTARKEKAIVLINGDIFHVPVDISYKLFSAIVGLFKKYEDVEIETIAGNHDLPFHSMEELDKSAYNALIKTIKITNSRPILKLNFGESCINAPQTFIMTHQAVFKSEKDVYIGMKAKTASELLKEYPKVQVIFTGDIHNKFIYFEDGRMVVNAGCMNIQTTAMLSYKPSFYLLDFDHVRFLAYLEIEIPQNYELVSDEFITEVKNREGRIESFVESIKKSGTISLSFSDNVLAKIKKTELTGSVSKLILEVLSESEQSNK